MIDDEDTGWQDCSTPEGRADEAEQDMQALDESLGRILAFIESEVGEKAREEMYGGVKDGFMDAHHEEIVRHEKAIDDDGREPYKFRN